MVGHEEKSDTKGASIPWRINYIGVVPRWDARVFNINSYFGLKNFKFTKQRDKQIWIFLNIQDKKVRKNYLINGFEKKGNTWNKFETKIFSLKKSKYRTRCTKSRGNWLHRITLTRIGSKMKRTQFLLLRDSKLDARVTYTYIYLYIYPLFRIDYEGKKTHLLRPGCRKFVMQPTPVDPRKCLLALPMDALVTRGFNCKQWSGFIRASLFPIIPSFLFSFKSYLNLNVALK